MRLRDRVQSSVCGKVMCYEPERPGVKLSLGELWAAGFALSLWVQYYENERQGSEFSLWESNVLWAREAGLALSLWVQNYEPDGQASELSSEHTYFREGFQGLRLRDNDPSPSQSHISSLKLLTFLQEPEERQQLPEERWTRPAPWSPPQRCQPGSSASETTAAD